jgi:hypothetical protein
LILLSPTPCQSGLKASVLQSALLASQKSVELARSVNLPVRNALLVLRHALSATFLLEWDYFTAPLVSPSVQKALSKTKLSNVVKDA